MAENLRVYATVGERNIYSVKKLTGEYTNRQEYSYRWIILNNGDNQQYGSILGSSSNEYVEVIWREPLVGEDPVADRILICEVAKLDANGNIIGCDEALRVNVSLTVPVIDLEIEALDGISGGEIVNMTTGEYKLFDQCHTNENILAFHVRGNENTKFIRIDLKNNLGQTVTGGETYSNGYFMESASPTANPLTDSNMGFYEFDVSSSSGETNFFIKFYGKPFVDGFYYIRAFAIDNFRNYSAPVILKFKLVRTDISIIELDYVNEVFLNEPAINFNYELLTFNRFPSWFKIDSYYNVGYINCIGCDYNNDNNYIGDNWDSEDKILIASEIVSNITPVNGKYTKLLSLQFPDVFIDSTSWVYGDPAIFRVKFSIEIYDPAIPDCKVIIFGDGQNIFLKICGIPPQTDSFVFQAPACPGVPPSGEVTFRPIVTINCNNEEKLWNGQTCAWKYGATSPCGYTSMFWNGTTCICPTGYQFSAGIGCVSEEEPEITCYQIEDSDTATIKCQKIYCYQPKIQFADIRCIPYSYKYYQDTRDYFIINNLKYYKYTYTDLPEYIHSFDTVYFDHVSQNFYNYNINIVSSSFSTAYKEYDSNNMMIALIDAELI